MLAYLWSTEGFNQSTLVLTSQEAAIVNVDSVPESLLFDWKVYLFYSAWWLKSVSTPAEGACRQTCAGCVIDVPS